MVEVFENYFMENKIITQQLKIYIGQTPSNNLYISSYSEAFYLNSHPIGKHMFSQITLNTYSFSLLLL